MLLLSFTSRAVFEVRARYGDRVMRLEEERRLRCHVEKVPRYEDVEREHVAVCGNAHSDCKPLDWFDVDDNVLSHIEDEVIQSMGVPGLSHAGREWSMLTKPGSDGQWRAFYGNDILPRLLPAFAFALRSGRPSVAEELAWRRFELTNRLSLCSRSKSLCTCRYVGCKKGRVSGARFREDMLDTWNVASLSSLKGLRVLVNLPLSALSPRSSTLPLVQSCVLQGDADSVSSLKHVHRVLPRLELLELYMPVEKESPQASDALGPETLEPLCSLHRLKKLVISGPFRGIPSCFKYFRRLIHFDARGCWFDQPLPQSLRAWSNLRVFIAFGQREHHCNSNGEGCLRALDNILHLQGPKEDHEVMYRCLNGGWKVSLESIMFPEWSHIEKFWVDQNFLSGTIPAWLPTKWTRLRSLDLYSNRITGEVPRSLVAMPRLFQLQLQDNDFTGSVPSAEDFSASLRFLDVSFNARLQGCWPTPIMQKFQDFPNTTVLLAARTHVRRMQTGCGGSRRPSVVRRELGAGRSGRRSARVEADGTLPVL